jgi:hypothetical protein
LRPRRGNRECLNTLATKLEEHGFITILQDRYSETEKLASNENRKELFKIIQGVINESLK